MNPKNMERQNEVMQEYWREQGLSEEEIAQKMEEVKPEMPEGMENMSEEERVEMRDTMRTMRKMNGNMPKGS